MILHGLSHQLTKVPPGPTVRNAMYDVMNHFELGIGYSHGYEAQARILEVPKITIKVLMVS